MVASTSCDIVGAVSITSGDGVLQPGYALAMIYGKMNRDEEYRWRTDFKHPVLRREIWKVCVRLSGRVGGNLQ